MKMGQHFLSKSKIQNNFSEYIFNGRYIDDNLGSRHNCLHLIAVNEQNGDIYVDDEWFNNRVIKEQA